MIKAAAPRFLLLALWMTAAPLLAQQPAAQSAEEEAVRRQEAIIQARQSLVRALASQKQNDLLKAARYYEDSWAAIQKVGVGVEDERRETVNGLTTVNLQLAQMAQRRGDYAEANARIVRIMKVDPQHAGAIAFRKENDRLIEAMKGQVPSQETLAKVPVILNEQIAINTLVRDGKLLYEMGKFDEAEAKLKQAALADPQNHAAFYYLSLIKEARFAEASRKREDANKQALVEVTQAWTPPIKRDLIPSPNIMARTNLVHTSRARENIFQKLNDIQLKEVFFDGLPLSEVIKFLSDEAKKLDPQKRGINFIINSSADAPDAGGGVTVDPATGAAVPLPFAEPVDLNIVTVKIIPPLTDVRLADVLDAITKVADKPIKYSVEDYAVVFTQKRPEPVQLYTRTFQVDPNTFIQGLESVEGISFGALETGSGGGGGQGGGRGGQGGRGGGQGGNDDSQQDGSFIIPRVSIAGVRRQGQGGGGGDDGGGGNTANQNAGISSVTRVRTTQTIQETVRQFFIATGVNLAPPATVFFNDRSGVLFVRATLQDLDLVEAAIQVLNKMPHQITIEAKFAEITQSDAKAVGFDWFLGNVLFGNGRVGAQPGTAPSYVGAPSPGNPSGVFPGPGVAPGVPGPGSFFPSSSDSLLTAGLRNTFGGGNAGALSSTPALATVTGILTDPQFRVVIRALEQRDGVDLLSAPKVTTISGRQTQIAVVDVVTVVSGVDLNQQQGGAAAQANNNIGAPGVVGTTIEFITQPLPFGPVLDVIPYVSSDGYTIQMTIIPTLAEFIGYDDPGQFVPTAQGAAGNTVGIPLTARLPLPRLRSRQLATSANVWDGQTIVLGGLISEDVTKIKDKVPVLGDIPLVGRFFRSESRAALKKNLVIFVTPTIIDPAGNRVHTDDELPFAQSTIPSQQTTAQ